MTKIDPKELEGKQFDLYGVDNNSVCLGQGDEKWTYEVLEDENDGYRSSMGEMDMTPGAVGVFNDRPIATVTLSADPMHSTDWGRVDDTWSLRDEGGHVWLTFGTCDTDDYYPYFVFSYFPKESGK